ncbi:hydrogenase maturation nickel metallochaperone HypA [Spirulina sp. CS-785/01]|uniref:hydrogenase maturation nickel metallochaperone HypA n=1 Tax=Spirulina sp. CS-785/01 TaxID=3021716 RepID=UPI00232D880B|nr:hydrogenase maturation nickel metallochaperone HypA [Spirulina sp. CS-785/01]MDB9313422.1 hydrogenase maturation nickel metallochaperone HypA [Spirulina sp. CS-785/01]
MHEVSIMEQTLDIALAKAQEQNASQIKRLKMSIGAMSGVVPEALEFAFDVVTQDTMAEGATLEIEMIPVKCYCPSCQEEFNPSDFFYECPQCKQIVYQTLAGREIELTELELTTLEVA